MREYAIIIVFLFMHVIAPVAVGLCAASDNKPLCLAPKSSFSTTPNTTSSRRSGNTAKTSRASPSVIQEGSIRTSVFLTPISQEDIQQFLGVNNYDLEDPTMIRIVRAPKDIYVFRGDFVRAAIGMGWGEERPKHLRDIGLYSGAAKTARWSKKASIKALERSLQSFDGHLADVIMESGGTRFHKKDPFITFSRNPLEALKWARHYSGLLSIVRIPKGELLIDISGLPEEKILMPHFVPSSWVIKSFRLRSWSSLDPRLHVFPKRLSAKRLNNELLALGISSKEILLSENVWTNQVLHAKKTTCTLLNLHESLVFTNWGFGNFYVSNNQTLMEALMNVPFLYNLFQMCPGFWEFHTSAGKKVELRQQLRNVVSIKMVPSSKPKKRVFGEINPHFRHRYLVEQAL